MYSSGNQDTFYMTRGWPGVERGGGGERGPSPYNQPILLQPNEPQMDATLGHSSWQIEGPMCRQHAITLAEPHSEIIPANCARQRSILILINGTTRWAVSANLSGRIK